MNRLFSISITAIFLMATDVTAHTGATGVVKQRMDAMDDMGDKSKKVADMFKGRSEFDKAALIDAASTFVTHGDEMLSLFPDTDHSRTGSSTDALPAIWQDWQAFSEQVSQFVQHSKQLQRTLNQADDKTTLRKAFFSTTRQCSACHKRFRKPRK